MQYTRTFKLPDVVDDIYHLLESFMSLVIHTVIAPLAALSIHTAPIGFGYVATENVPLRTVSKLFIVVPPALAIASSS